MKLWVTFTRSHLSRSMNQCTFILIHLHLTITLSDICQILSVIQSRKQTIVQITQVQTTTLSIIMPEEERCCFTIMTQSKMHHSIMFIFKFSVWKFLPGFLPLFAGYYRFFPLSCQKYFLTWQKPIPGSKSSLFIMFY